MTTKVKEAIEKLTVATDIVKEVETTTDKHYSLNQRFTVIRDGKEYYIAIKKVDVNGQVIKSHIRFDIDTDLPRIEKQLTKKEIKIAELEAKLKDAKINKVRWAIFQYSTDLKKLRGY